MRSFAKKMMQLPLTASLYGMKQLADLVVQSPTSQASPDVVRRLEHQFVTFMREALIAGDRLSEETLDPLLLAFTQQGLHSGHLYKTGIDAVRVIAESLGARAQGSSRELVWQELGNKLQSFGTFRYVETVLDIAPQSDVTLPALIHKANACDSYIKVWATEGVGHFYAERVWQDEQIPTELLTDETLVGLPLQSLIALHAGMGLSLAKHCLRNVHKNSERKEVEVAVARFVELCTNNARPGYVGISFEALGLIVQTLYPTLCLLFDQTLHKLEPNLLGFYWHGVGRGAYFMPRSSLTWDAQNWASLRAPHELGQRNLLAGLAWPVTLVNIRHPEIMAQFIARNGDFVEANDAFATGIAASLIVWRHSTRGDAYLDRFCNYQKSSNNQTLHRRWTEWVQRPSEIALSQVHPLLEEHQCFDSLFYYQSQDDLLHLLKTA